MRPAELPKELIKQFDHKKNKIKISEIKKFSNTKVWWRCEKGHSWSTAPKNRYKKYSVSGCPMCYGLRRGKTIKKKIPEKILNEINLKKNKNLDLKNLTLSSKEKIWWKCNKGHEWKTALRSRVSSIKKNKITGCPKCAAIKSIIVREDVISFFNKKLNPGIDLKTLPSNSKKIITWQCPKNKDHIWKTKYLSRSGTQGAKRKCPYCTGNKVEEKYLLKNLFPNIYSCIIKKNKKINYEEITSGSGKRYEFKCPKGSDHIFTYTIEKQTKFSTTIKKNQIKDELKCPFCRGFRLSKTNSLNITHPNIAKLFDEKKNKIKVSKVLFNGRKKYWFKCSKENHSFNTSLSSIVRGLNSKFKGCKKCMGIEFDEGYSLKKNYPKLFKEIDKKKYSKKYLESLSYRSSEKINWICSKNKNHKWSYYIFERVKHSACPFCTGRRFHQDDSLLKKFPEIAKLFCRKLNKVGPEKVKPNDVKTEYFWRCDKNHSWITTAGMLIYNETSCPICAKNFKWDKYTLRAFLLSIKDHINNLSPAEKFLIFQQTGFPRKTSGTRDFVKNFANGKIPIDEIEKFIEGKNTSLDKTIEDIEKEEEQNSNNNLEQSHEQQMTDNNIKTVSNNDVDLDKDKNFPKISTSQVLKTLSYLVRNVNQEAIEFLIASAKHKIWKDVFRNEKQAIVDLKKYNNDEYVKRVQFEFLNEYKRARALKLPKGYSFEHEPNLMQKLTAAKVIQDRRIGNWSGTGAGKTLSAILASRYIEAKNVVVCCPNALAQKMDTGWAHEIVSIFPDSNVRLKSFEPLPTKKNNFYVLNFEAFQQKDSSKKIVEFLKKVKVDFVIIDEIHYSKQRQVDNLSLRKKNITSMLAEIQKNNKKLHVLGMSATPVINNLYEGRSLVEMITGEVHKDLPTQININNCMKLHQKLSTIGLRWMPDYKMKLKTTIEDIDCSHITNDVKELGKHPTPLDLEKLLTREKIQTIKKHIEPKTLIYTHYLEDIANYIKEELETDGYKVGFFTGEDKSGLEEFKNGSLDVLIGSRTIGTGVNGLQDVCKKIIINSLPWTHAEYEQLIGRVYRQGQKRDVEIVVPLTEGTVNGKQWSWCKSRYDRIKFKKTVGDAAVDGVIPSEEIRTEAQVLQDLMKWIKRISGDDDFEIKREPIKSEFVFDESDEVKRIARYGDFSKMNREWNNAKSSTTHEKIKNNPDLWHHYHQMFEEHKKKWTTVPSTEIIKYFKAREGLEIGDFGCGKALLHQELSDKHIIHSFDHHAFNSNVITCDISKTPLNNKQLDVAVFSLSLMGSNIADYITEANRTLKLDGRLFLIESTSRFKDINQFKRQLIQFGFDHLSVKEMGKFTQIKCDKVKDISFSHSFELYF